MTHLDLNDAHLGILADVYAGKSATLDDLPYKDEFEQLYGELLARTGLIIERRYVWKALCNCRKAGRLARKAR